MGFSPKVTKNRLEPKNVARLDRNHWHYKTEMGGTVRTVISTIKVKQDRTVELCYQDEHGQCPRAKRCPEECFRCHKCVLSLPTGWQTRFGNAVGMDL